MNSASFQQFETVLKSARYFVDAVLRLSFASQTRLSGWSLSDRDPQVIEQLMPLFEWFYQHYFRVVTDGWAHIPTDQNVLLIGSHNGGLAAPDMLMMAYDWFRHCGPERPVYGLMDTRMWLALPGLARLATQVGALRTHPRMAIAALRQGASVLIYPGGARDVFRPYPLRRKIYFHGEQAFIKLALREAVPIVPLISYGAHSTLVVLADIYPLMQQLHEFGLPWLLGIDPGVFPIYLGWPWGVAIGPLPNIPWPHQIYTRVCAPITFERYGDAAAHDPDYVQACYTKVCQVMQQELDQLSQRMPHSCLD